MFLPPFRIMHLPDISVVNFPIPSAPVIAVVEVLPHLTV